MGPSVRRVDDVGRRLLCLLHESSLTLTHHGVRVLGQFGNEVGVVLQHHQGSEGLRPREGSRRGSRLLHQAFMLPISSNISSGEARPCSTVPYWPEEAQERLDHFGWYETGLHVRLHHRTSCGDPKSGNSGRHSGGKKAMPVSLRCQGRPAQSNPQTWTLAVDAFPQSCTGPTPTSGAPSIPAHPSQRFTPLTSRVRHPSTCRLCDCPSGGRHS